MINIKVPRRYGNDERFYVVCPITGAVWNRKRRVWDEGLNIDNNPSYHKLGFAKKGAVIAQSTKAPVTVVAVSLLEEFYETLP